MIKKIGISLSALFICTSTFANEGEARTLFSTAVSTALNFKHYQIAQEISLALPHFTSNGRSSLLNELDRNKIIDEAAKNNASLQSEIRRGSLNVVTAKTHNDLPIYETSGIVEVNWLRCVQRTCVPVGDKKSINVTTTIVQTIENNRPSLKIDNIRIN